MNTNKKIISIVVIVMLLAVSCIGLISYDNDRNSNTVATHTITDMQGNEVEVPCDIESVAITSMSPMVPVLTYYMNGTDKLVGANSAGLTYAKNGIMGNIYDFDGISTDFVSGTTVNVESLTVLDPDVVIYTGNRTDEHTLLDGAGLTNVGFNTAMTGGNSIDPFEAVEAWVDLLKDMFGDNGRGTALTEYNTTAKELVSEKISTLSENDMPSALIIFSINSDGTISVCGSGHYSEYWLDAAGASNVASGLTGIKKVSMEQIDQWNPDYIFFANSSGKMPTDLINNTIDGQDWSTINAVRNSAVYVFPSATYFSYAPSLEAGVTLQFLAKILHPDLFPSLYMEDVVADFFDELFDYTATSTEIEEFLYPDELSVKLH